MQALFILESPRGTDYPTRGEKALGTSLPITLLLPWATGDSNMIICRQKFSEGLQTFYVFLCPCTASFRLLGRRILVT